MLPIHLTDVIRCAAGSDVEDQCRDASGVVLGDRAGVGGRRHGAGGERDVEEPCRTRDLILGPPALLGDRLQCSAEGQLSTKSHKVLLTLQGKK